MPQVMISGWYGCGNLGDEAILTSIFDRLRDVCPDVTFTVLTEVPERVARDYGGRYKVRAIRHRSFLKLRDWWGLLWHGDLSRLLGALRAADVFLLGGGGLIRDNTSFKNLLRVLDECLLAKLMGTRSAWIAVGVGPVTTWWGRALVRLAARSVDVLTVRDAMSRRELEDIGVRGPIHVTGDPALLLERDGGEADGTLDVTGLPTSGTEKLVGVFPCEGLFWDVDRRGLTRQDITGRLAQLCDGLVERYGMTVVFVPFRVGASGDDDVKVIEEIVAAMTWRARVHVLGAPETPRQALEFVGALRFVIGARLHAIVLAAAGGVPALALDYEPKVGRFVGELGGAGMLIDIDRFDPELCLSYVEGYERSYLENQRVLVEKAREAKARARETFELLRPLIESPNALKGLSCRSSA